VLHGDCLAVMPTLEEASVDAVVCDPPYGLSFMGKNWDHGIPGVAFWAEALRVAKPGAHLVAFGGTRTFHRLACAIEDAGWEIRDTLSWLFGQGFPKSHNLPGGFGTALKPAYEPIILARKPLAGTVARTVSEYGTGALNIDGCRVGADDVQRTVRGGGTNTEQWRTGKGDCVTGSPAGRWPANVVLSCFCESSPENGGAHGRDRAPEDDGGSVRPPRGDARRDPLSDGVPQADASDAAAGSGNGRGVSQPAARVTHRPDCAVRLLDEQSGERGSFVAQRKSARTSPKLGNATYAHMEGPGAGEVVGYGDTGGASRFFYTAKASRREREAGLEGMPRKQVASSNGAKGAEDRGEGEYGDPSGLGLNSIKQAANVHPTVKPLALMRWLCRLVTPPNGTILDPFTGSGSTGCAAMLEGFRFVGIEQEAEYVEIARRRIAHWAATVADTQPELGVA
jgi:site-specific DNA-methyltransferase (adenine-specific)